MTDNNSSDMPSFGLSFVLGVVLLSVLSFGWDVLTAVEFGALGVFYAFLVTIGLVAVYVSFWRPHRLGLLVIPIHLAFIFGYFGIVQWGYRTPSELAVVVVSWGLLVGVVAWNADYFTGD